MFDGVHLGHQQVIRQTTSDARQHGAVSVAVTFDRHPNAVVAPERVPPLIYSLPQKLSVTGSLGVEAVLLIPFDRPFSRLPAEEFVRGLSRDFGQIHSVCVGSNFTFGHRRTGNVALLRSLGQELKFTVHGLAAVSLDGQTVSSTRIREAIRSGNLDAAGQMLGRTYSLMAVVTRGDQLGRRLGFPTANLDVAGLVLPPHGVYAVQVQCSRASHPAVANIGLRPTLEKAESTPRVEVHLIHFEGDLYGQTLEVVFVEKLRDEKKFASLEELRTQIVADVRRAEALLAS
jgi:riboflavin kinase/FMN adenylyltransferase